MDHINPNSQPEKEINPGQIPPDYPQAPGGDVIKEPEDPPIPKPPQEIPPPNDVIKL